MTGPEVPPPSAALLARVAAMRPVRTRRPRLELGLVALASLALVAALVAARFVPRPDLDSAATLAAVGATALAFAAELWWALVPPAGQVLPARPGAGRRVLGLWVLAVAAMLVAGHQGGTGPTPLFMKYARTCFTLGCLVAVVPAALCLILLRRGLGAGGWALGLVVGAAGGALGGLLLELHCPSRQALHLVVAHGGAMALPALVVGWVASRRP